MGGWIAETEAERARLDLSLRQGTPRPRIAEAKIEAMIGKLGDMAAIVRGADPSDRSEVYQQLGLRLIYQPGRKVVQGAIHLDAAGHWFLDGGLPTEPC